MADTTIEAALAGVKGILSVDTTISETERAEILNRVGRALHGKPGPAEYVPAITARRPVTRQEFIALSGLSPASVDRYARLGFLERVAFGSSSRASGFTAESVEAFLAGHVIEKKLGAVNV